MCPASLGHVAQGEAARAGWDSCFHGFTPSSSVGSVRRRIRTHSAVCRMPSTHRAVRETHGSLLVRDALGWM
ncbi:hypothetical protein F7725_026750, partial [Dissostichus mawsoni]